MGLCSNSGKVPIEQAVRLRHPSFRGLIGLGRADITPPIGIYARNWGAAEHDVADGIHRSLTLTAVTFQEKPDDSPLVLVSADAGWWHRGLIFEQFQTRVLEQLDLSPPNFVFALTHTHAAPPLADSDPALPGGALLGDYLQMLQQSTVAAVRTALANALPALLEWHIGRCGLAANRDLPDPSPATERFLCGFNPQQAADDTLLVGRITDRHGVVRGVLVNYACHPTTLAWENHEISPDYVGALREVVESACGDAPLVFLQGASGDLAPRYQYVGDTRVADRHGRQIGYAVLQTLQDMAPPGFELHFARVVESGAPLAVWRYRQTATSTALCARNDTVELPLKNWPTTVELEQQLAECQDRVLAERLRRKLNIRRALGDGTTYRLPFWTWRLGDVLLAGSRTEAYSALQQELRRRFCDRLLICMNLVNGAIGYLPPRDTYDQQIYQVWQTPLARGSLELTVDAMARSIELLGSGKVESDET